MSTLPKSGQVIVGKYRLERELGAGGMGAVWLATQLMVDRPVAVKLLHPAFVDQAELQARFEVEAKAIGKLNHPNVITLYDFGYSDDLAAFYTVIEYIDGVSLDKRLGQKMRLSEVISIIRQIALALDHAHHFGILHRDLKPENVMLARMTDGSEMVKVLDFGIARIVKGTYENESPESQRITKAGEVFGTPAYMSPEQARSIRRLNPSADLYSLGVMFYELAAGRLPFFANSAFDLLMLHVTKPVPPIQGDVPSDVMGIIFRLLEKEPEKRYQSGKELVKTLDRLTLPEESEVEDDEEFEGFPTLVSKMPEIFNEAPALGNEETNPHSAPFALPTPGHVPPTAEIRAQTVLLHGGGVSDASREHDTLPQARSATETRALFAIVLVALLVLGGVGVVVLRGPQDPPPPTKVPQHLLHAPTAAPEDELPDAPVKAVPEPVELPIEEPAVEPAEKPAADSEGTPDAATAKPAVKSAVKVPPADPPAAEPATRKKPEKLRTTTRTRIHAD